MNRVVSHVLAAFNLLLAGLPAYSAEAMRMDFGELKDGTSIEAIELSNSRGAGATIITLGATLQSLSVPDRNGKSEDIVLGYATADEYLENPQYFGATVGRYANRIARGQFTLDGKQYTLPTNQGPNHLHGGPQGLDKMLWTVESVSNSSPASVTLSHSSPDGEAGYPGTLDVTATYTLNDKNELSVEYRASTDKPTIVNITNHAYFNLAGEAGRFDVMDHRLTLLADRYTPVDETLIPTGELREVAGTAFDFRESAPIGLRRRRRGGRRRSLRRGQLVAGLPPLVLGLGHGPGAQHTAREVCGVRDAAHPDRDEDHDPEVAVGVIPALHGEQGDRE